MKAYPRETTEAFLDGHGSAFAIFSGVSLSILYENLRIAVARICGDGNRERTRAFAELVSHYLLADRFGRPGKGNDMPGPCRHIAGRLVADRQAFRGLPAVPLEPCEKRSARVLLTALMRYRAND